MTAVQDLAEEGWLEVHQDVTGSDLVEHAKQEYSNFGSFVLTVRDAYQNAWDKLAANSKDVAMVLGQRQSGATVAAQYLCGKQFAYNATTDSIECRDATQQERFRSAKAYALRGRMTLLDSPTHDVTTGHLLETLSLCVERLVVLRGASTVRFICVIDANSSDPTKAFEELLQVFPAGHEEELIRSTLFLVSKLTSPSEQNVYRREAAYVYAVAAEMQDFFTAVAKNPAADEATAARCQWLASQSREIRKNFFPELTISATGERQGSAAGSLAACRVLPLLPLHQDVLTRLRQNRLIPNDYADVLEALPAIRSTSPGHFRGTLHNAFVIEDTVRLQQRSIIERVRLRNEPDILLAAGILNQTVELVGRLKDELGLAFEDVDLRASVAGDVARFTKECFEELQRLIQQKAPLRTSPNDLAEHCELFNRFTQFAVICTGKSECDAQRLYRPQYYDEDWRANKHVFDLVMRTLLADIGIASEVLTDAEARTLLSEGDKTLETLRHWLQFHDAWKALSAKSKAAYRGTWKEVHRVLQSVVAGLQAFVGREIDNADFTDTKNDVMAQMTVLRDKLARFSGFSDELGLPKVDYDGMLKNSVEKTILKLQRQARDKLEEHFKCEPREIHNFTEALGKVLSFVNHKVTQTLLGLDRDRMYEHYYQPLLTMLSNMSYSGLQPGVYTEPQYAMLVREIYRRLKQLHNLGDSRTGEVVVGQRATVVALGCEKIVSLAAVITAALGNVSNQHSRTNLEPLWSSLHTFLAMVHDTWAAADSVQLRAAQRSVTQMLESVNTTYESLVVDNAPAQVADNFVALSLLGQPLAFTPPLANAATNNAVTEARERHEEARDTIVATMRTALQVKKNIVQFANRTGTITMTAFLNLVGDQYATARIFSQHPAIVSAVGTEISALKTSLRDSTVKWSTSTAAQLSEIIAQLSDFAQDLAPAVVVEHGNSISQTAEDLCRFLENTTVNYKGITADTPDGRLHPERGLEQYLNQMLAASNSQLDQLSLTRPREFTRYRRLVSSISALPDSRASGSFGLLSAKLETAKFGFRSHQLASLDETNELSSHGRHREAIEVAATQETPAEVNRVVQNAAAALNKWTLDPQTILDSDVEQIGELKRCYVDRQQGKFPNLDAAVRMLLTKVDSELTRIAALLRDAKVDPPPATFELYQRLRDVADQVGSVVAPELEPSALLIARTQSYVRSRGMTLLSAANQLPMPISADDAETMATGLLGELTTLVEVTASAIESAAMFPSVSISDAVGVLKEQVLLRKSRLEDAINTLSTEGRDSKAGSVLRAFEGIVFEALAEDDGMVIPRTLRLRVEQMANQRLEIALQDIASFNFAEGANTARGLDKQFDAKIREAFTVAFSQFVALPRQTATEHCGAYRRLDIDNLQDRIVSAALKAEACKERGKIREWCQQRDTQLATAVEGVLESFRVRGDLDARTAVQSLQELVVLVDVLGDKGSLANTHKALQRTWIEVHDEWVRIEKDLQSIPRAAAAPPAGLPQRVATFCAQVEQVHELLSSDVSALGIPPALNARQKLEHVVTALQRSVLNQQQLTDALSESRFGDASAQCALCNQFNMDEVERVARVLDVKLTGFFSPNKVVVGFLTELLVPLKKRQEILSLVPGIVTKLQQLHSAFGKVPELQARASAALSELLSIVGSAIASRRASNWSATTLVEVWQDLKPLLGNAYMLPTIDSTVAVFPAEADGVRQLSIALRALPGGLDVIDRYAPHFAAKVPWAFAAALPADVDAAEVGGVDEDLAVLRDASPEAVINAFVASPSLAGLFAAYAAALLYTDKSGAQVDYGQLLLSREEKSAVTRLFNGSGPVSMSPGHGQTTVLLLVALALVAIKKRRVNFVCANAVAAALLTGRSHRAAQLLNIFTTEARLISFVNGASGSATVRDEECCTVVDDDASVTGDTPLRVTSLLPPVPELLLYLTEEDGYVQQCVKQATRLQQSGNCGVVVFFEAEKDATQTKTYANSLAAIKCPYLLLHERTENPGAELNRAPGGSQTVSLATKHYIYADFSGASLSTPAVILSYIPTTKRELQQVASRGSFGQGNNNKLSWVLSKASVGARIGEEELAAAGSSDSVVIEKLLATMA